MTRGAMDPLPTAPGAAAAEAEADEEADPPAAGSPVPPSASPGPSTLEPPGNPLLARDPVQVELVPEKKGLFLKHVEYAVSSRRFRFCVYRRCNDFVVFREALLHKGP